MEEILEINGLEYKKSTLVDFGKKHDTMKLGTRIAGFVLIVLAALFIAFYFLVPVIFDLDTLIKEHQLIYLLYVTFGNSLITVILLFAAPALAVGIFLIAYSFKKRNDDYFISIAKEYIE